VNAIFNELFPVFGLREDGFLVGGFVAWGAPPLA
jgi:hypothetical protein